MDRKALEERWFHLTREQLPAAAVAQGWPVRFDHCFQRILLDNAVGRKWPEVIPAPAYRNAPDHILEKAVALAQKVIGGESDLVALNRRSLKMRGKP